MAHNSDLDDATYGADDEPPCGWLSSIGPAPGPDQGVRICRRCSLRPDESRSEKTTMASSIIGTQVASGGSSTTMPLRGFCRRTRRRNCRRAYVVDQRGCRRDPPLAVLARHAPDARLAGSRERKRPSQTDCYGVEYRQQHSCLIEQPPGKAPPNPHDRLAWCLHSPRRRRRRVPDAIRLDISLLPAAGIDGAVIYHLQAQLGHLKKPNTFVQLVRRCGQCAMAQDRRSRRQHHVTIRRRMPLH